MIRSSRKLKFSVITIFTLFGLCILLTAASAISNLELLQRPPVIETLSEADKIRLAEAQHLIQTNGSNVWIGWGRAEIPTILYNQSYAFLVGYLDPPAGWVKVPVGIQRGGDWKVTPGDSYNNQPYYRQRLPDPEVTPEAFTVLVGERWVASISTLDWMKISLVQTIRQDIPVFLRSIFPYRFFVQKLVGGSNKYISLITHEAFHAYQGMAATDKFAKAERSNAEYSDQYPWNDSALQADWQAELDLLAEALKDTDQAKTIDLVRRFLILRAERRNTANLPQELVSYEQQREWLEGLARYSELEIWRQASAGVYNPIPETDKLSDFDNYTAFTARWSQELSQIGRMANDEGDGRFYYSGMAQAFLLDRLAPDWKRSAFDEDVWLEELLAEAAQ